MKPFRLLPAMVPILIGLLLPTIAFHIAQAGHGYAMGQDEDLDVMVARAAAALPLVTAVTMPGFLGFATFLIVASKRFDVRFLWLASLVGSGIMTAIILGTHPDMYDLLYSRGRMHSTTGIGIMFVSAYCIIAAVVTSALAWYGQTIRLKRR